MEAESEVVSKLVREQPENHRFSHLSVPGKRTCLQTPRAREIQRQRANKLEFSAPIWTPRR